jgi:hypothetical protein
LVVLDGAKALHKAVREVFGERALIHRCHAHKKRNVLEALPQGLVRNFVFLSQLVNERSSRGQRLRIGHLNRSAGRSQGWP